MSDWISVKDRLPRVDLFVIAFSDVNGYILANREIYRNYETWCINNIVRGFESKLFIDDIKITHWKELPKPPTK